MHAEGLRTELQEKRVLRKDIEPTFKVLKLLAEMTDRYQEEFGLQAVQDEKGVHSVFVQGEQAHIHAPQAKGRKVFFHTHPFFTPDIVSRQMPYDPTRIFPSFEPDRFFQDRGDLANSSGLWNMSALGTGTSLNICSREGITLQTGSEALDSSTYASSRMRMKQLLGDKKYPVTIKVFTGPAAGESFTSVDDVPADKPLVDPKEGYTLVAFDHFEEGTRRFQLFLTWSLIDFLGLNLQELCFGKGVDELYKRLSLKFPHTQNLNEGLLPAERAESRFQE